MTSITKDYEACDIGSITSEINNIQTSFKLFIYIKYIFLYVQIHYSLFRLSFLQFSRAILKNQDLQPETPIGNIWYDDFWGTPLRHSGSHKSYRPLVVLTFRLNYAIHQLSPGSSANTPLLLVVVRLVG